MPNWLTQGKLELNFIVVHCKSSDAAAEHSCSQVRLIVGHRLIHDRSLYIGIDRAIPGQRNKIHRRSFLCFGCGHTEWVEYVSAMRATL